MVNADEALQGLSLQSTTLEKYRWSDIIWTIGKQKIHMTIYDKVLKDSLKIRGDIDMDVLYRKKQILVKG